MALIANLQYGWALFVEPIDQKTHWGQATIAGALPVFVLAQTWLMPFPGWLADRFGPRFPVLAGGILAACAWTLDAFAVSPSMLLIGAALGGAGAGAVYAATIGNTVKWFADWRGIATGLAAAAFGIGAAAGAVPIRYAIGHWGYETAFLAFGLGQGAVIALLALFLRAPASDEVASARAVRLLQSPRQYNPAEMLASPVFWILYAMGVLVCTGGLLATAQLAPAAKDFGIGDEPAGLLGLSLPALALALSLDRVLNGVARPVFGLLSDLIGREFAMLAAFGLEAAAILALSEYGHSPGGFIAMAGLVVFGWGAVYSLFPALCADVYGSKHASTNAGILFTTQGVAVLLLPYANAAAGTSDGTHLAFIIAVVLNLTAALASILILRPARLDLHTRSFVSLTGPAGALAASPAGSGGNHRRRPLLGIALSGGVAAALAAFFLLPGKETPKPPPETGEKLQVIVTVPEDANGAPAPLSNSSRKPAEAMAPAPIPEAAPQSGIPEARAAEGKSPAPQAAMEGAPVGKPASVPAQKPGSSNKKEKKKKKSSVPPND